MMAIRAVGRADELRVMMTTASQLACTMFDHPCLKRETRDAMWDVVADLAEAYKTQRQWARESEEAEKLRSLSAGEPNG